LNASKLEAMLKISEEGERKKKNRTSASDKKKEELSKKQRHTKTK